MKLMITLNIQKFVHEYNCYATMFDAEGVTSDNVYNSLEKIFNSDINREIKCNFVLMTAEEIEKFAEMFVNDGWREIALDEATKISFFK